MVSININPKGTTNTWRYIEYLADPPEEYSEFSLNIVITKVPYIKNLRSTDYLIINHAST